MLPGRNETYALHLEVPVFRGNYVESDCCPKCKRIILDASDYDNNL
jgi:Zn-finger nucleic acid-binding protein